MTDARRKTMQAATIGGFGGIDQIRLETLPVPRVEPGEVLIRVEAAGVGSWDAQEREGAYDGAFGMKSTFPYVLGWDGAGTVAVVGTGVTRFAEGDRVYAASIPLPKGGFYAEYAAVSADHVAHVPGTLSIEQAGAMPWDALTAISGVEALGVGRGDALMVFGASGGIGHMAVQIAARVGARVLAVASGDDGVALVRQLGADAVVDGRSDDVVAAARAFAPDGLGAALVTTGGEKVDRALTAMREGGRAAWPRGVWPEPAAGLGVDPIRFDGDRSQQATAKLNHLIETGPFEVHVAQTFPLRQAVEAHRALTGHYLGKLALRVR